MKNSNLIPSHPNLPEKANLAGGVAASFCGRGHPILTKVLPLCLGLGLAGSATSHAGLVAYWDLDTINEDLSSTAGTLSGDASVGETAIAPSGSGSLTTSTGFLNTNMDAGDISGFGGTSSFTVLSWIQTTSATDQAIFSYSPTGGSTGGADLRYFAKDNGDFRIEMSNGAGFNLSSTNFNLIDGNTHMVGVIFNSATGNSFHDVDLYVDGTLYDVTGGTDHTVNIASSGEFITIGQKTGTSRQFVGTIDDVAIYDEALGTSALASIATNGIPEPSSSVLLMSCGVAALACLRRRERG